MMSRSSTAGSSVGLRGVGTATSYHAPTQLPHDALLARIVVVLPLPEE
jgi:hypothetical protein